VSKQEGRGPQPVGTRRTLSGAVLVYAVQGGEGIRAISGARRTLSGGVLAFRWIAFAWMVALNLSQREAFRRPALAWAGIAVAGAWTAYLSVKRGHEPAAALWLDLALSTALIIIAGLVVVPREVAGPRLFYATAYPLSTALAWGAAKGLAGALMATIALSVALVLSRTVNGISLEKLTANEVDSLINGAANYLLAGGITGVVSRYLDRSTEQLRSAIDDAMRARERVSRLAERESLARKIHDSVLQVLANVHKQGRELGEQDVVSGSEVRQLADLAGAQERALRDLLNQQPDELPTGVASLREALEDLVRDLPSIPITVSSVGSILLDARAVDEIALAVRQALENTVRHAKASRATVFADAEEGGVTVWVRDDGQGFEYDEAALRASGKVGILKSMKGRVEDLGGRVHIQSKPGAGTEVEFWVPVRNETA
jgi:signal transduction histidine kinase